MTVKDRVGRNRYVAFQVESDPPPGKDVVIRALKRISRDFPREMKPWLVFMDGPRGLLRCSHLFKGEAIQLLQSLSRPEGLGAPVRTLGTSGTIRAARQKFLRRGPSLQP